MGTSRNHYPDVVHELAKISQGFRGVAMQAAISFRQLPASEHDFELGRLRVALADYWQDRNQTALPVKLLREVLILPVPVSTVLKFCQLNWNKDLGQIELAIAELVDYLGQAVLTRTIPKQTSLFDSGQSQGKREPEPLFSSSRFVGEAIDDLELLIADGAYFSTIYADPPWAYDNTASRGAAVNHYPTLPLNKICELPVAELCRDNAHLHLWTTNAFLRDAFTVMDAWGFKFKSCLIWIKDEMGMGNYWRVSHEYLLFGVRGRLPFQSNRERSWIRAKRTIHSRKPSVVRSMIEKTSPSPYLELFGRESLPDSLWTVFGNQVEPKLF